ncbi:hypothetical protein RND81_03G151000 [Saponaria officinalis]|uniref:KIB1-4 beta-propeller domain-containing protein n=1 Tax=Saponaria officinalis TaxID=3572 RepID=A0AAW1M9B7_SAPOF
MAPNWSLLPDDIVADIALKSDSFEDFIQFSAVCQCWNRASSLIKHQWSAKSPVPWLLLAENTRENPNCVRKLFNISNNKFYQLNLPQTFGKRCWGSACGWVAMVDRDHNVELFNPITKAQISFPSLESMYKCAAAMKGSMERCRVEDFEVKGKYFSWFMHIFLNKFLVIKVSQGDHYRFVVMILYHYNERLAFARHGDQTWTSIIVKESGMIADVVVKGDYLFALYQDGSLVHWNVKEFCRCGIVVPIDYCQPADPKIFEDLNQGEQAIYLVQSDCDLFMVLRFREEFYANDGRDIDMSFRDEVDESFTYGV